MNTSIAPIPGVPVADQDRALACHRDVLGLAVRMDAPFGDLLDFGAGVPPMFSLRDPDGNELRVVQLP
jgi:hypothetical protein